MEVKTESCNGGNLKPRSGVLIDTLIPNGELLIIHTPKVKCRLSFMDSMKRSAKILLHN